MADTILIVEDEEHIRDMIKISLELAEFTVHEASHVHEAKQQLAIKIPDLILLDWMLPGVSGVAFIKQLKENTFTTNIPIILLTAKAEEENKIKGLESGADDYITKPFSPRELIVRIKTVLRRGLLTTLEGVLTVAGIHLDTKTQQVMINQERVTLSPLEYRLLLFFLKHPQRVYTRDQLLTFIWGGDSEVTERTVDVCIKRLRTVLDKYQLGKLIQTVRGTGYRFSDDG